MRIARLLASIRRWRHGLRHLLGLAPTQVVSKRENGDLWLGHRCTICGKQGGWWRAPKRK